MTKSTISLDKIYRDPLFWSVLMLNLFVIYKYGTSIDYLYNIAVIQIIQTFSLLVAHYFLLRNTPITYLKKKYRLNRTRKKTDKNRKEYGSYIEKDESGNSITATLFLVMACFISVFMACAFYGLNLWKNEGVFVFQWSDLASSVWAIANGIMYYRDNKKRLTYSNAHESNLVAVPLFKFFIPLIVMFSGYFLMMKVVGDIVSFVLSNPKYREQNESDELKNIK